MPEKALSVFRACILTLLSLSSSMEPTNMMSSVVQAEAWQGPWRLRITECPAAAVLTLGFRSRGGGCGCAVTAFTCRPGTSDWEQHPRSLTLLEGASAAPILTGDYSSGSCKPVKSCFRALYSVRSWDPVMPYLLLMPKGVCWRKCRSQIQCWFKKWGWGSACRLTSFDWRARRNLLVSFKKIVFLQWWRKHSKVQVVNGERRTLDILQCGSGQRVQRLAAIQ